MPSLQVIGVRSQASLFAFLCRFLLHRFSLFLVISLWEMIQIFTPTLHQNSARTRVLCCAGSELVSKSSCMDTLTQDTNCLENFPSFSETATSFDSLSAVVFLQCWQLCHNSPRPLMRRLTFGLFPMASSLICLHFSYEPSFVVPFKWSLAKILFQERAIVACTLAAS